MKMRLLISGMSCEHCINHVKNALLEMDNVKVIDVDLKGADIEADDSVTEEMLRDVIDEAGYDLDGISRK
ncbi:MAG: heavy-metal-associated domain-containing protein [Clostridiales bacterium]|jgi:copper chaperone CopZ|nr:heavy-metal-associated domain-containing protein [Clostridiales bacterium]